MLLEGLSQARADCLGSGRKKQEVCRDEESFSMPERGVYMEKVQGDGVAKAFEWQPEELGPYFQYGELAQWTAVSCQSPEWRGVAATSSEPKAH